MDNQEKSGQKKFDQTGVLLVNLGSPQGTDYWSMRRYLRQFLSDRRVIETPLLAWLPILHALILSRRPQKSGAKYRHIWNYAANEPPLVTFTRSQAQKLQKKLDNSTIVVDWADVDWAMRYGEPSIAAVIDKMMARGCQKLLLFPLYPQYSATTTASVMDAFFAALKKHRFVPAWRTVPSYPDDPAYIDALVASIKTGFEKLSFVPERLIVSYHGLPLSYVKRGDPYLEQCERTTRALARALCQAGVFEETKLLMGFQSRFGREIWLQPYTEEIVPQLARDGVKSIAIINPGFVTDCLETLDEMGHEVARLFRAAGGENFAHIACLNDSENGIKLIETLVRRELSGWI